MKSVVGGTDSVSNSPNRSQNAANSSSSSSGGGSGLRGVVMEGGEKARSRASSFNPNDAVGSNNVNNNSGGGGGGKKISHDPSRPKDPRPKFPSIKIELLSNNSQTYVECPPNSRTPIPFETALFKGSLLIVHITDPVDSYYKHMFAVPKNFEVQMQGKFKKIPQGQLYCGAEAIKKMELGFLTRKIAGSVLTLAGTMINGTMHYSYGDETRSDKSYQVPHLVAPMFSSLGKVIVTPPHETPPALGSVWNENPDFNKARKKFRDTEEIGINLDNTYSFGVFTGNLDLVNWAITGVPITKSISMTNFFGDSPIQLVSYEYPQHLEETDTHLQKDLKYIFALKLTPIETENKTPVFVNDPSDDEQEKNNVGISGRVKSGGGVGGRTLSSLYSPSSAAAGDEFDSNGEDSGDERVFRHQNDDLLNIIDNYEDEDPLSDGEHGHEAATEDSRGLGSSPPESKYKDSPLFGRGRTAISGDDVDLDTVGDGGEKPKEKEDGKVVSWFRNTFKKPADVVLDVPEAAEYSMPDSQFGFSGDLRFCPACIEVSDFRNDFRNARRIVYLIPWSGSTLNMQVPTAANSHNFQGRLVSYSEFSKQLTMVPIPKLHKNKKMAFEEKRRRQIAETHKHILTNALKGIAESNKEYALLQSMLEHPSDIDKHFLTKPPNIIKKAGKFGIERWEGPVATAKAHRHWVEMYLILSKTGVSITKHVDVTRRSLQINISSIIAVRMLRPEESPIPYDFPIFQVETVSRVHYFMVKTQKQAEEWLGAFKALIGSNIVKNADDAYVIAPTITFSENEDAYLAKPSGLKIEKRRIFNYRKIIFRPECIPESFSALGIPGMVESILRKSFELVNSISHENKPREVSLWIRLLDEISSLQMMDFAILGEKERVAVFLNIYHSMILHGGIVLGLPIAWTNWQFFFNTVTYILGCELVSIAELEFNILRASMAKSSNVISKTFLSTSFFPQFALNCRDFRLNFAINSGSISMNQNIPIYTSHCLDRQLDEITSIMVNDPETGVDINSQKKLIVLPKLCSSFLQDFSIRNQSTSQAQMDCLRALSCYIYGENRQTLIRMLSFSPAPTIKFKPFNFACRKLLLFDDESSREHFSNHQQHHNNNNNNNNKNNSNGNSKSASVDHNSKYGV